MERMVCQLHRLPDPLRGSCRSRRLWAVLTGCEMTMTEHREAEWRALIAAVRQQYHGPVSYNCDKYGEDHVNWWDAVDCIASSGYYP